MEGDLGRNLRLGMGEQRQLHRQVNAAVRDGQRSERRVRLTKALRPRHRIPTLRCGVGMQAAP